MMSRYALAALAFSAQLASAMKSSFAVSQRCTMLQTDQYSIAGPAASFLMSIGEVYWALSLNLNAWLTDMMCSKHDEQFP